MKKSIVWALAAATAWGVLQAGAQLDVQTVSGFRVPQYDDEGNLKYQLFGELAKVLPDEVIEITGLKLEMYNKAGETEARVTAPTCTYDKRQDRAGSRSDVRIAAEKMIITGTGFLWNSKNEQFQIFKNVKVVIKDARENVDAESGGLGLDIGEKAE